MQGIVYLLLERKSMSAGELAAHFEVSSRTIHRDVETLSQAGIPIYTIRGSGGGIRLMDEFVLNKMVLSQRERQGVGDALQGLRALRVEGTQEALEKLSALFGPGADWIEIDFSEWDPASPVGARFTQLKQAILTGRTVSFRYSGVSGRTEDRTAEPVKLVFRGGWWYLLGWCRRREDWRYFKLSRMDGLKTGEAFQRRPPPAPKEAETPAEPMIEILARASETVAFRVRDEASPARWEQQSDGGYLLRMQMRLNEWMYQYLLTFGAGLEVLSPEPARAEMRRRLREAAALYGGLKDGGADI